MKLYGIPNCNTVKNARTWLAERQIPYGFHDFKKQGVPEAMLLQLMQTLGWEALVNRKGPTWRKLDEATKAGVTDAASVLAVMKIYPSIIKRPIVEHEDRYQVGFSADSYAAFLHQQR